MSSHPFSELWDPSIPAAKRVDFIKAHDDVGYTVHVVYENSSDNHKPSKMTHQGWVYVWCSCVGLANLLKGKREDGSKTSRNLMPLFLSYKIFDGSRKLQRPTFVGQPIKVIPAWSFPLTGKESSEVSFDVSQASKYQINHMMQYLEVLTSNFVRHESCIWLDENHFIHIDFFRQDYEDEDEYEDIDKDTAIKSAILFRFFCPYVKYLQAVDYECFEVTNKNICSRLEYVN